MRSLLQTRRQESFLTQPLGSLGQETGNYRLTSLGEPKLKEEPSLISYVLPLALKPYLREEIDDISLKML